MLLKSTLMDKNSDRGGLMCWLASPHALIAGSTKVCTALLAFDAEALAASLALNLASFTSVEFDSHVHKRADLGLNSGKIAHKMAGYIATDSQGC